MNRRHASRLSRYVAADVLTAFCLSLVFVSLIASLSFVFKIANLIAMGVPGGPILQVLFYSLPTSLAVAAPLSVLVSCLLVFGRLSSDGEIVAMQTAGIGVWAIMRLTLVGAAALCAAMFYLLHEIEPRAHLARRIVQREMRNQAPIELIEPGRFVRPSDGVTIFVGRKRDHELSDVRIVDSREPGLRRELRAASGTIRKGDAPGEGLSLELRNVRVTPFARDVPTTVFAERWTFEMPELNRQTPYRPNEDDMTFAELLGARQNVSAEYPQLAAEDLSVQRSILSYELHRRSSMSLSGLAFALIGIPLGIRSRRRQSTVGIAMALGLYAFFYYLTTLAGALARSPYARADLLTWIPVLLLGAMGAFMLRRIG